MAFVSYDNVVKAATGYIADRIIGNCKTMTKRAATSLARK